MELVTNFTNTVNIRSAYLIENLQTWSPDSADFFVQVSRVADPWLAFTAIFPILAGLHSLTAAKFMGAIVLADGSNQVFKWLLMGDRPYWWVGESRPLFPNASAPILTQYPVTCETGPGTPSGHCTMAAVVGLVLLLSASRAFLWPSKQLSDNQKSLCWNLGCSLYVFALLLVSISRVYVATHFPHQCFLGILAGLAVVHLMYSSDWWLQLTRIELLLCVAALATSAALVYGALLLQGVDPQWTITMAVKWCTRREYIHVETMPFFAIVRYLGAGVGLAFAVSSKYFRRLLKSENGYNMSATNVACCALVAVAMYLVKMSLPRHSIHLFYGCSFLTHAVETYILLAPVPYHLSLMSGKSLKSKYKKR